ncbi:hypothetical protein EDC44_101152 [Cricetibacter osteomyelitidis]|uniref:Uncharacterized protein n=1 Tax=Cricetibacter osteomyelitidis TaxID=1521931 RepID=A0A4R2T462_9PAST|nr:hypothetical protein [Cricetibacter osteomyelitidis]TCP97769.1 hypothetical protein EDC44_101152 [Cricetibacter osteomyelitidis]
MNNTNTERYRNLRFSIRKCGEDEIEIRHAIADGYIRGLIRVFFIGLFCVSTTINANYARYPFYFEIKTIKNDLIWSFNPDKILKQAYMEDLEFITNPEMIKKYNLTETPISYDEFKKNYLQKRKIERFRAYFHFIWIPCLFILLCLPRARGIRVNRKKRIIYARLIDGKYSVAFVPKKGDPLGGVTYSCCGIYPFGWGEYFSLSVAIYDKYNNRDTLHNIGVYPSVNQTQTQEIVDAVRAYLTEEEPEFLQHIGNRYKVWGGRLRIACCNAFAIPIPFRRKKAEREIDAAIKQWNRQTIEKKQNYFNDIKQAQSIINQEHAEKGLDNRPW